MTPGEKIVRVSSNPSKSSGVDTFKARIAKDIDYLVEYNLAKKEERNDITEGFEEFDRKQGDRTKLLSRAIYSLELAEMWATKAMTV